MIRIKCVLLSFGHYGCGSIKMHQSMVSWFYMQQKSESERTRKRDIQNKIHFYDENFNDKLWDFPYTRWSQLHHTHTHTHLMPRNEFEPKKGFMRLKKKKSTIWNFEWLFVMIWFYFIVLHLVSYHKLLSIMSRSCVCEWRYKEIGASWLNSSVSDTDKCQRKYQKVIKQVRQLSTAKLLLNKNEMEP